MQRSGHHRPNADRRVDSAADLRRNCWRRVAHFFNTTWQASRRAVAVSDASNARAKAVLGSGEPLVTSDHVLVETWILLRHRIGRRAAERFWEGLRSGVAALETVGV